MVRALHDAPPPPWEGTTPQQVRADLDRECSWLLEHGFDPDAPGCGFEVLRARMRD